MRIALLTYRGNMFCGGQGIYAAALANELHTQGHEVHVISGPPLPELSPEIPLHVIPNHNAFGLPVREAIPAEQPFESLWPSHLWELAMTRLGIFPEMTAFGLRLLTRWKDLQTRHRFDVVLDNQSLTWGLLGVQATGVPVVSTVHHPLHIDRQADYQIDTRFSKRWERTLYFPLWMQELVAPRLSHILTVSKASSAAIQRHFRVPARNISVVYNGTDSKTFHPVDRPIDADFIFVGRTEDRKKGIVTLLEAFARTPEKLTLKLVDGRIPAHGLVMQTLRRLGIASRVKLVRRMLDVPELVDTYSSARVALVPSFFEGFGFPAAEAMACGLPVIATSNGALPEVVGNSGKEGLLVPFGNPDALARAMTDLTGDPQRCRDMGEAARRRIKTVFSWPEAARRTADVLAGAVRAYRRP